MVETISNHVKWLAIRMLCSYLCSGHFGIRLDWDRPHERTRQGRNKCTRRGDVKQLLPNFSSCPLASTAACPCPQPAMPLFTLQKASSCFHNLVHSDRKRAEWYTSMPCLELQQHLKRRCKPLSVPIQNIQLIGNKIQSLMNLSLFAFCRRGPNILPRSEWLTCWHDWWYGEQKQE